MPGLTMSSPTAAMKSAHIAVQSTISAFGAEGTSMSGCSWPGADVLEANEVGSPQLAVDSEVEQREVPCRPRHLKSNADRPDLPGEQWAFLPDDEALVPRVTNLNGGVHCNILAIPPTASLRERCT